MRTTDLLPLKEIIDNEHINGLEDIIIGSLIAEDNLVSKIVDILSPSDFRFKNNNLVYDAITILYQKSFPIDVFTVSQELRGKGELEKVGGISHLSNLTNNSTYDNNVLHHALIIKQYSIRQQAHDLSFILRKKCEDDTVDIFETIDMLSFEIAKLQSVSLSNIKKLSDVYEKIKSSIIKGEQIAKVFSVGVGGIEFLTKTFNIIAGFQGTGKTAMLLTIARRIAMQGTNVGIMSLEMSEDMLTTRYIQRETMIGSKRILSNNLSDEEKQKEKSDGKKHLVQF